MAAAFPYGVPGDTRIADVLVAAVRPAHPASYESSDPLQGLSARGPGGLRLQRYAGQGSFAERLLVPTENVVPLGPLDPAEAGRWCALTVCLVPYGGLLAAGLQAGETVLVSGSTGYFGGAAVAVALAMGAAQVIAPGRSEPALAALDRRFGPRVRTVRLSGDADTDGERMTAAARGPVDVVLDLLPPAAGPAPVRTAAMTVREFGRIVLMGGVGMLGGPDLSLPYPWLMRNGVTVRGQWMYPRDAPSRLAALARCGRLDLDAFAVTGYPLADADTAVARASEGGAFTLTVINP